MPNTPVGTDLVYPVYGTEVTPGSAGHPLPITRATEMFPGEGCVDGEDALWITSARTLRRYDASLAVSYEVTFTPDSKAFSAEDEYVEGLACDANGVWIVVRKSSNSGWIVKVARYTKDGLAEEHTVNASDAPRAIRMGPDGPLVEFYNSPLIIDETSYEKPADQWGVIGSAVFRVLPIADLPRVVWIPGGTLAGIAAGGFAVDADGSYLAVWPERSDPSLLHFRRYGADGVENASREISGQFQDVIAAVKTTTQGHLILAGHGGADLTVESTMFSPIITSFMLALDRDGNLLWTRRFRSPWLPLQGVAVAGNSAWLYGGFAEWIESDGFAAFGQLGPVREGRSGASGQSFAAVVDAAGGLSHLEPLGPYFDTMCTILPTDDTHAVMLGTSTESLSEAKLIGLAGPLPQRFLGKLDLTGRRPATMPPQPEEQLPRLALPQDLGRIVDVRSSHDGNAYVVFRKDGELTFVDYVSGQVQPVPLHLAADGYHDGSGIERLGPDLFYGMARYRLQGSEWVEMETLEWDGADVGSCHDPILSGDWLFRACDEAVLGWRRQGERWELATHRDEAGGSALAADESFLVVGNAEANGQRKYEGDAHVFPITADGLGPPVLLKPSDPLPYEPGSSGYGADTASPPPPGKHFGRSVQVATPWVVVSDEEASYGFEHVGDTWVERWKQTPDGVLLGDKYYVFDAMKNRGMTDYSGVIHIYERDGNTWKKRQRVVPTQRWESRFGESFVRLADRLLVTAPGYGHAEGFSSDDYVGAVFSIPFGACPK